MMFAVDETIRSNHLLFLACMPDKECESGLDNNNSTKRDSIHA